MTTPERDVARVVDWHHGAQPSLSGHEAALVAFGRFMVNADPSDPRRVDYAEMGRLAAAVINGIPTVRRVVAAEADADRAEADLDTPEMQAAIRTVLNERHHAQGDCSLCAAALSAGSATPAPEASREVTDGG